MWRMLSTIFIIWSRQITDLSAGKLLKIISEEIAQNTFTQMQRDKDDQSSHHFAAMKRILDRETRAYVE